MNAVSLDAVVLAAVLVGLRVSGLLLFAPGLSNPAIPPRAKATLAVLLVALLWPVAPHMPAHAAAALGTLQWGALVAGEMFIGMAIGILTSFIFDAAQFAGQVMGMQMGFSMATMMDPQSQADSPVLSVFHQMLVLLIFFSLDVHHWILRALVQSFYYLPAGTNLITQARAGALLHTAGAIWVLGLQIAAPALIATMVADFVLAFLGKASPQLPVLMIGISVKSVLGMLVFMAALAGWSRYFTRHFTEAIGWCEQILHLVS